MGGAVPTAEEGTKPKGRVVVDAAAGAIAGCIARFIVGPLDVIKIRFQVQLEPIAGQVAAKQASKYTGFTQALFTIAKEEGVKVRCNDFINAMWVLSREPFSAPNVG